MKPEYATALAVELRRAIENFSPAESARLGETVAEFARRESDSAQAVQRARYFAQYLKVDRVAFLGACGIKP